MTAVHAYKCQHPADPHRRHIACKDIDFGWDETLAGNWDGLRTRMKQVGITPTMSYISVLQSNVAGGSDQVWSYAGQLSLGLDANLHRIFNIPGMKAYLGMSWGTGSNLAGSLDSMLPTNGLYAPSFYLGELYLQQSFAKRNATIAIGRLAPSNSFAALPVFTNFVTYAINPNPFSLGANDPSFFGPPTGTEWGSQASINITSSIEVASGAFNTNLHSANGEGHGTDFGLQEGNKGALVVEEVSYLRNQPSRNAAKPGQFSIGFLQNNNHFLSLQSGRTDRDGYKGLYIIGQQMVYRPDGAGTIQGMTLWGSWTYNSNPRVSPMPAFCGGGMSYTGLAASRKSDVASAAWLFGSDSEFSHDAAPEHLLELNYQWRHSTFLTITPHFQTIWKRTVHKTSDSAIIGIQLSVTL